MLRLEGGEKRRDREREGEGEGEGGREGGKREKVGKEKRERGFKERVCIKNTTLQAC